LVNSSHSQLTICKNTTMTCQVLRLSLVLDGYKSECITSAVTEILWILPIFASTSWVDHILYLIKNPEQPIAEESFLENLQANLQSGKSRIAKLVEWTTHGLDNSRTGQLDNRKFVNITFGAIIFSPIFASKISASWPIRELSCPWLDWPRAGLLASC